MYVCKLDLAYREVLKKIVTFVTSRLTPPDLDMGLT